MSGLHRRTVLVGAGEQEASPSAPISSRPSTALRKSNLAAVDNRDRPAMKSRSSYSDNIGVLGSNRTVEVNRQSQVVGNRREGVINSHAIIGGKEDKKLALDLNKKLESRPEDIDECAEAFIRKFRQDLRIQRLESLENYEQMLARGL